MSNRIKILVFLIDFGNMDNAKISYNKKTFTEFKTSTNRYREMFDVNHKYNFSFYTFHE